MDRHVLHTSRPTLPSLRSQVGEFLPEPTPSNYPHSHAQVPTQSHHRRRLSMSSSSMLPLESSFSQPRCPDDRRFSSSTSSGLYRDTSPGTRPSSMNSGNTSYASVAPPPMNTTRSTVSVACTNCRSAHLACSDVRPCRRCVQTGRAATCIDVEPRKRGRPRASDMTPVAMTTAMMHNLTTESTSSIRPGHDPNDLAIIMSTSLRCALVTERLTQILGHTMLEQPLSAFICPEDKQDYARFSIALLRYPGVASRPVPVSATRLHQTSFAELFVPLAGAQVHVRDFRLRAVNNSYIPFRFESYLGGGFGAHPSEPDSLRLTYVVLKLTPAVTSIDSSRGGFASIRDPSAYNSPHYEAVPSSSIRSSSHTRGDRRGYEAELLSYPHQRSPSRSGLFRG